MNLAIDVHANLVRMSGRPGLIGQVMALAHYIHRESMERLLSEARFKGISLSHEGYISRLIERDYSPGELSEVLGVSKQACSKAIGDLQTMGLIERRPNPQDARSSVLSLSPQGHEMVAIAIGASRDIEERFKARVGAEDFEKLVTELETLCEKLGIEYPLVREPNSFWLDAFASQPLTMLLPAIRHFSYSRMILMLEAKGFAGLKPAFSQVLGLIGPQGGRIQNIAALAGVSKQSIAANASLLESLGYITRERDPQDHRQLILKLSPSGSQLMSESTESINRLTNEMRDILGADAFDHMIATLEKIFAGVIGELGPNTALELRVEQLARELLDELGNTGARLLGQKLLNTVGGSL